MISASGTPGYEAYYGRHRNREDAKLRDLLCRSAVLRPKDREREENEWISTNKINFKVIISPFAFEMIYLSLLNFQYPRSTKYQLLLMPLNGTLISRLV